MKKNRKWQTRRWQLVGSWLLAVGALAGIWGIASLGGGTAAASEPAAPNVPIADWCVTGQFNNWNNNGNALNDAGLDGDLFAGDGIYSADLVITATGRTEIKAVECENWGVAYPSDNAWTWTTTTTTLKFTFDTNDYSGNAGLPYAPTTNIVNVVGDAAAAQSYTVVGPWQSWDNNAAATAMTNLGNGHHILTYTFPISGSYEAKVSATGDWNYQVGADGRNKSAPTIPFNVPADNAVIAFYFDAVNGRLAITESTTGSGTWCVAGGFNGFSENGYPLNDDGTSGDLIGGDGVFSLDYTMPITPGRYEFKINACSWATNYPGENAWTITSVPSQTVKFTFDTNDYSADAGWPFKPTTNIVNAWDDFVSPFVAVGPWQGWNNGNPATTLADLGYNQSVLTYTIAGTGASEAKVTNDGWNNQMGADGRSINAPTIPFNTVVADQVLNVYVDGNSGRVVSFVVPVIIEDPLVADVITHTVQDEVFYFLLPDRFDNGDNSNDEGAFPGGTLAQTGFLATDKSFYHGGDLTGLESQLDYLQGMGVTSLWLTPVFENKTTQPDGSTVQGIGGAYHGYWIKDFENIDPHLGSEAEVMSFIAAAHARGMKVFFDIVVNHTADYITYQEGTSAYRTKEDYPYRDANGDPFDDRDYAGTATFPPLSATVSFPYTPVFANAGDETAKTPSWLNNPIYYHNRGDSSFAGESSNYGDFFGLDDLFTEHPDVVTGFIDVFTGTISTYGIDGFRLDTVKHVNTEFWQKFVPAVMTYAQSNGKPDFFIFGEVFSGDATLLSYYTTEAGLPSVLDFGLQGNARGFAEQSQATNNLRDFFAADDYYTDADSNAYQLANFVSNHDGGIERFGYHLRGTLPGASDGELVDRMELAYALPFFARGFPVIYYGDEQGFTGGGSDKNAREDMFPSQVAEYNANDLIGTIDTTADDNFNPSHPLYQTLLDYSAVYTTHAALRYGAQIHRYSEGGAGIYAFSRIDNGEKVEYVVVLNNSTSADSASIPTWSLNTQFTPIYPTGGAVITTTGTGELAVNVPALSVTIYRADAPLAPSVSAPGDPIFTSLTEGQEVVGRVEVGVDLANETFAEVTFAVSVDGAPYEVIGTDNNAPYRVFYDTSAMPTGTSLRFKATVKDVCYAAAEYGVSAISVVTGDQSAPGGGAYAIFHYYRPDGDYGDYSSGDFNDYWGLHIWGDGIDPSELPEWTSPRTFTGFDEYGAYLAIRLDDPTKQINFIVHKGNDKDGTNADRFFDPNISREIWLVGGDGATYYSRAEALQQTLVHYQRDDATYDDWGLHLWQSWGDMTTWPNRHMLDSIDDFGAVYSITVSEYPSLTLDAELNFIIHDGMGTQDPTRTYTPTVNYQVWVRDGRPELYTQEGAAIGDFGEVTLHYRRCFGDYGDYSSTDFNDFWGLHTWGGATGTDWTAPRKADGQDSFGVYFTIPLVNGTDLNYILHRGNEKDVPEDQTLDLSATGYEIWVVQNGNGFQYVSPAIAMNVAEQVCNTTSGDLSKQRAHWLSENTFGWEAQANPLDIATYRLYYAPEGGIALGESGITGGSFITLTENMAGLSLDIRQKFPHLAGLPALEIDTADLPLVPSILKGQIAIAAFDGSGSLLDATGLQIPSVLDDLYTYNGDLGVTWSGSVPTLRVWAPTAKNVTLHLFNDSLTTTTSTTYTMALNPASGVWSVAGDATWKSKFYLYEVEVYVHSTGQVEHNIVTDPYSFSLSTNSLRSQIVNLDDAALAPAGWTNYTKPVLEAPEDISIYELHVRDFSIFDETVPQADRGTFKAFTDLGSNGMQHLLALQEAGLTHIHLLPAFDIATINENAAERTEPDYGVLASFAPSSTQQQALLDGIRDQDGFNWGYDPLHYTVPEGSYSTNPDGTTRIVEFRDMVQTLNENGLLVVMDVVYNHTNAAGQASTSILDRIVPGYYHRLNGVGAVESSTCCANTASEHAMFEKLMIDSLVTWAKEYKVDAFRFDLMGHHMITNMVNIRAALDSLTVADDGVDGTQIYLYGEGWNFGEVANNARGINATQLNVGGLGIGTFSDRLRDAVRGPGPFDSGPGLYRQGFANGLFYDANLSDQGTAVDQRNRLLLLTDQIKVGLAGNLAAYELVDRTGTTVTGAEVDYNGQPAGYTEDPQEVITYIDKHDNQTLFDINAYAVPTATATMADRVRIQQMGLSVISLGQGVPFYHAGMDILRSKSLDRNSYNSGDWFNRLDFTYQTNNWGVGLPPQGDNGTNWYIMEPLLANPALKPAPSDIQLSAELFREWLEIRYSSRLFRLATAEDVMDRVTFYNAGPTQTEGLIVMGITDVGAGLADLDALHEQIVVLFNANDAQQTITVPALAGAAWELHPTQQNSVDAVVQTASVNGPTGAFTVPGRTTAVFIVKQPVVEQGTVVYLPVVFKQASGQGDAAVPAPQSIASQPLPMAGLVMFPAMVFMALPALRRKRGLV